MKSKLICRMLMLTLIVASIGVFSSCKDYDEDRYAEFNGKLSDEATLREGINQQLILLKGRVTDLETFKNGLQATLDKYVLKTDFNTYKQEVADSITSLRTRIESLENSQRILTSTINRVDSGMKKNSENIDSLFRYANGLNQAIIQSSAMAKQALELAKNDSIRLDNLILAWGDSLKTAYENAAYAKAKADANAIYLHKLDSAFMNCKDSISNVTKGLQDSIDSVRILANNNLTKANQYTDNAITLAKNALLDTINVKIGALTTAYKDADKILQDQINTLNQDIKDVNKRIDDLAKDINARFTDALTKLVTGIIVQGTDNPVFGSFALPVDVRSNVLMAYYGYSDHPVTFPSSTNSFDVYKDECLTSKEISDLNPKSKTYDGTICDADENGDINAGTLYLTINPTSANLSGTKPVLVNSQDIPSKIELGAVTPSSKTLTFGYTRGTLTNGFYESAATLNEKNIDAVKINIEPGLKSSMKEVLTSIKNRTASVDLTSLVTNVYNQFNGVLDANGVRYSWSDALGTHSVYSQYNIAATAFKPLSFKFLYGTSLAKLPTITPLTEFDETDLGLTKFSYNFNIDSTIVHVDFGQFSIQAGEIYVIYDKPTHYDNATGVFTYEKDTVVLDSLKNFATTLQNSLNKKMSDEWAASVNKQMINLINTVNDKVQAMIDSINGYITDNINTVLDKINNKYVDRANNYISKYNKLANKLNKYLKDPNHYLQVCMLYQDNNADYHQLSNSLSRPSTFKANGGNCVLLTPTTYTAEIAAPAFKKYVAVTNVYKDKSGSVSAKSGDAGCVNARTAANGTCNMNTVFSGQSNVVGLYIPTNVPSGYVYEITYSALDYSGYTSTRRFYIQVNR